MQIRPSRWLATAALIAPLSGCSLFPSHEEVWEPVAPAIGERRITGADTAYVVEGRGYQLVSGSRQVLADVQPVADNASFRYRRYFGSDPAHVVARLVPVADVERSGDAEPDSAAADSVATESPAASADSSELRIPVRSGRRSDIRYANIAPQMVAQPLARAWLRARAGSPDSASPAGWVRVGMTEFVAATPLSEYLVSTLARDMKRAVPLGEFLSMPAPERSVSVTGAEIQRPMTRGSRRTLDGYALFAAQSIALLRFIEEREGTPFVTALYDRTARGESAAAVLAEAQKLPKDPAALEQAWREWMKRG